MSDVITNLYLAHARLRNAADDVLQAACCRSNGRTSSLYEEGMVTELQKAAEALGYELVKRNDKQEAA